MPVRPRLARFPIVLLLTLLLGAQAAAQRPAAAPQTPEDRLVAAMHGISSNTILDWVKEMASEKYEGRLTGTPSYDASAAWTADLLQGVEVTSRPATRARTSRSSRTRTRSCARAPS